MREIDASNALDYLREIGRLDHGQAASVRELAGGVSNIVLRVDAEGQPPYVLKQCRERLRVAMDWRAPLERIWVEVESLELLADLLPEGAVPRVLFLEEDDYLFAMTCASEGSATWKERLMAGVTDMATAEQAAVVLAALHSEEATSRAQAGRLADTSLFDHLRIDPYYRTVARAHPELQPEIDRLIRDMQTTPDRRFVHGDYSPKNMLLDPQGRLMLLDFECAHAGDPAFDLGFFLTHLFLKAFRSKFLSLPVSAAAYLDLVARFWTRYISDTATGPTDPRAARAARHLSACLLARLDGKSPVEYCNELNQVQVRQLARQALSSFSPVMIEQMLETAATHLA